MGLWIPTTRVQCENGEEYDDPSEDMLHDLLSELSWPWNRFLIVDRLTDGSPGDRLVYM